MHGGFTATFLSMFALRKVYAGVADEYLTDVLQLVMNGPGVVTEPVRSQVDDRSTIWCGDGASQLGLSGEVTDRQVENLFVDGLHPDADRMFGEYLTVALQARVHRSPRQQLTVDIANAAARHCRLGEQWRVYEGGRRWRTLMYRAYSDFNCARGQALGAPIPDEQRAAIREAVARQEYERMHGHPPADEDALRRFLRSFSHRAQGAVAGFDLCFTPGEVIGPVPLRSHLEAVHAALRVAEAEAAWSRRGAKGVVVVPTRGLVMAAVTFTGDDVLRTHVAVSSKVQGTDGRWSALTAGRLYQAAGVIEQTYRDALGPVPRR